MGDAEGGSQVGGTLARYERILVGSALVDPSIADQAIEPDLFRDPQLRAVWAAISNVRGQGLPVDLPVVNTFLGRNPADGLLADLLSEGVPSVVHWALAHMRRADAHRRKVEALNKAIEFLRDDDLHVDKRVEYAVDCLISAAEATTAVEGDFTVSMNQMLDASEEQDDAWLIETLIARKVVGYLAGLPKLMKTWLALFFALCVASGRPVFGRFGVRQGSVLFATEEDPAREIRRRLLMLGRGMDVDVRDLPIRFSTLRGLLLDEEAWVRRLEGALRRHQPSLLIIDALARVHSQDENDRSAMRRVTAALQSLATAHGVTVLVIHHFRKTTELDRNRRAGERMRGSGGLWASARFVIGVEAASENGDGAGTYVVRAESNFGEVPEPFVVRFQFETNVDGQEMVRVLYSGGVEDARNRAYEEAVLATLQRIGQATRSELKQETTGVRDAEVLAAVARLLRAGVLEEREETRPNKRGQARAVRVLAVRQG